MNNQIVGSDSQPSFFQRFLIFWHLKPVGSTGPTGETSQEKIIEGTGDSSVAPVDSKTAEDTTDAVAQVVTQDVVTQDAVTKDVVQDVVQDVTKDAVTKDVEQDVKEAKDVVESKQIAPTKTVLSPALPQVLSQEVQEQESKDSQPRRVQGKRQNRLDCHWQRVKKYHGLDK